MTVVNIKDFYNTIFGNILITDSNAPISKGELILGSDGKVYKVTGFHFNTCPNSNNEVGLIVESSG